MSRRVRLVRVAVALSAASLVGLTGCGGGGTTKAPTGSAPPVDPCALLGDAAASTAMGEQLSNAHEPVRFQAVTRGIYGFQCKWADTTGTSSVQVIITPPPGGQRIYHAATHIPASDHVSPRPGTTVLDGVPGVAITLPGEIEFITPQGLISVTVDAPEGQTRSDSVARMLAPVVAANLAKLSHA